MEKPNRTVLVINSGSSSIKYQLVDPDSGAAISTGLVEKIGEEIGSIKHQYKGEVFERDIPIPDHAIGLKRVLELFDRIGPNLDEYNVVAVGHRVVQGGNYFDGPALIDEHVRTIIESLCPLAPLHNPAHLLGIDVAMKLLPNIPHIAVFDTAFFQHLPAAAATYAINSEVAQKFSIRRYGAHGTSHQYVSQRAAEILGRNDLKLITCHLGNGASIAAVEGGVAVDTSMGLTPLEGLVMGTRTGDIDSAVVFHLVRNAGMSIDEVDNLFNKQSGLKGLTGVNDMREVRRLAEEGNEDAQLALKVYEHRLIKYIGSYIVVMGGIDAIVFTAGAGENDARIRAEVINRLGYRGIKLDPEKNQSSERGERIISSDDSTATVLVIPTNEELAIARQALTLV